LRAFLYLLHYRLNQVGGAFFYSQPELKLLSPPRTRV
jgi:hypothetical protein